jgi:hypothetical protein
MDMYRSIATEFAKRHCGRAGDEFLAPGAGSKSNSRTRRQPAQQTNIKQIKLRALLISFSDVC